MESYVKKYLLFVSQPYYPEGGMYDCVLRTNDFEEVMKMVYKYLGQEMIYSGYNYTIQYYDVETDGFFNWDKEEEKWKGDGNNPLKIYYAHHLWKYNTEIEEYELNLIRQTFPNATICNPSVDINQHQNESDIMKDCLEAVDDSDIVVFSSVSGVVGKGVYDEVTRAKKVCYIHDNEVRPFYGELEMIWRSDTGRVYAIVREDNSCDECSDC